MVSLQLKEKKKVGLYYHESNLENTTVCSYQEFINKHYFLNFLIKNRYEEVSNFQWLKSWCVFPNLIILLYQSHHFSSLTIIKVYKHSNMIRHWKKGLFSVYHRTQIAADRPGPRKLTTAFQDGWLEYDLERKLIVSRNNCCVMKLLDHWPRLTWPSITKHQTSHQHLPEATSCTVHSASRWNHTL